MGIFVDSQVQNSISMLPMALLARILQHVPQEERLASCALVSKAWAAAAAAATVSIHVEGLNSSKTASLQSWVELHARQLQSLRLQRRYWQSRSPLQLPCAELQQLSVLHLSGVQPLLQKAHVNASSSSTQPPFLPALKDLRLISLTADNAGTLLQFASCTGVTQLRLESVTFLPPGAKTYASRDRALEEQAAHTTSAALGLLKSMTQLQRLHFVAGPVERQAWMGAVFTTSITALTLSLDMRRSALPCVPQSLSRLVDLQELSLDLEGDGIDPHLLAGMSLLQRLTLQDCALLPDPAGVAGPDALLAAVGSIQQLQHLVVTVERGVVRPAHALTSAKPSSCAALTASNHLTHMEVGNDSHQPLPMGASQHMFPPGLSRPQLRTLILSWQEVQGDTHVTPFVTGAELADMISACPALNSLDIVGALQQGSSCSSLLKLPETCRELCVGGDAFGDTAADTLKQLTQLTSLRWTCSDTLTDAGLYKLTALTGLQELYLRDDDGLSDALMVDENDEIGGRDFEVHLEATDQVGWGGCFELRF